VIKVENLSKQYRLGQVGTGTISHDVNRWWHKIRGKEDPYLNIGESNDRTVKGVSDYVWALNDINFEVNQGEVLGIIGRNGAGKSTLLKILSRTTTPTTGSVKIKGRVASLLEVGTGFHPELSGRENIFLNGAILGMTKTEIKSKFDEIVDFAGVERYIDTPVKRYSSGMYVRLAFGVSAHLESEILIVDEVLAVGDAEFQKKCLGKMGEVSKGEGRTVLFVSHNMSAFETLCDNGVYLKNGTINFMGNARETITRYLRQEAKQNHIIKFESLESAIGNENVKLLAGSVTNALNPAQIIDVSVPVNIEFTIVNLTDDPIISIGFDLQNLKGDTLFGSGSIGCYPTGQKTTVACKIPGNFLNDGGYTIYFYVHTKNMASLFEIKDLMQFEVKDIERENGYLGKINGIVRPKLDWEVKDL
jgi:lipopolysaccharide transport system ATP-binding protein